MATMTERRETTATTSRSSYTVFNILLGLAALAVLLQGVWAGIFLQKDGQRDKYDSWVTVHARGADVAIVLAALAAVWALAKLRRHRDLWVGAGLLTVLLIVEAYIGGVISDDDKGALAAVHIPLAMALMAMAVWLPLRAKAATRTIDLR